MRFILSFLAILVLFGFGYEKSEAATVAKKSCAPKWVHGCFIPFVSSIPRWGKFFPFPDYHSCSHGPTFGELNFCMTWLKGKPGRLDCKQVPYCLTDTDHGLTNVMSKKSSFFTKTKTGLISPVTKKGSSGGDFLGGSSVPKTEKQYFRPGGFLENYPTEKSQTEESQSVQKNFQNNKKGEGIGSPVCAPGSVACRSSTDADYCVTPPDECQ